MSNAIEFFLAFFYYYCNQISISFINFMTIVNLSYLLNLIVLINLRGLYCTEGINFNQENITLTVQSQEVIVALDFRPALYS